MQRDGGPGGAGGAGNPTGGSFTGPAQALEIVGDFCYATTNYEAETTPSNKIEFTSGNFIADVEVALGPLINPSDTSQGKKSTAQIQFNGATVMTMINDGAAVDSVTPNIVRIIIPAYTEVAILIKAQTDSASYIGALFIAGRIYRG